MELIIKIAMNEIEAVPEHTVYNHICYKFTRRTLFGITHVIEKYDDVNDNPDYEFCKLVDGRFVYIASGYGDPIDTNLIGFSGAYREVTLPDFVQ